MKIEPFGKSAKNDNKETVLITIDNGKGMSFSVTDFGATLVSVVVPDKNGNPVDVNLGYSSVEGYENNWGFLGATIGRVCGRIDQGKFTLNGKEYQLDLNDGDVQYLHGGFKGYDTRLWAYQVMEDQNAVAFYLTSPDGDQGFPGELTICVKYSLDDNAGLKISYTAVPDADTIISMTNHAYWNLAGHDSGDCLDQVVQIHADFMNELKTGVCPNGGIMSVKGTAFDFTSPHKIGERIHSDEEQVKIAGGYDGNHVINNYTGEQREVANAYSEKTGIYMTVTSDLPGMVFYSSNFVDGYTGAKGGAVYQKYCAFCMETTYFPNGARFGHFPSAVFRKGEVFKTDTTYRFSVK